MKKAISILLVLVMVLSLCACGSTERAKNEVKNILIETPWSYSKSETSYDDGYFSTIEVTEYDFSNSGTVGYYHRVTCYYGGGSDDIAKEKKNGTYTIESDRIIVSYDDGRDTILKYEYNDGELKLYQELYDGTIIYFTPPQGP